MATFYGRGLYKAFTRHVAIDTAVTIILAATVSASMLYALITFGNLKVPRSVPFIQAAFLVVCITSLRFFIRAMGQNINIGSHKNIAIYGAGIAGRQLVEAPKWNNQYRVCQLIDDDPCLHGQSIAGLKIESFDVSKTSTAWNRYNLISNSICFIQNETTNFDLLTHTSIEVKSIPDLTSLISGTPKSQS